MNELSEIPFSGRPEGGALSIQLAVHIMAQATT
jgi:hypothetical protein